MRWRFLMLLVCFAGSLAWADTVWMKNGDRLSGTIVLLEGGRLVLQTPYAGRVLINWGEVSTLDSQQPLLVKQSAFSSEQSKTLTAAGEGMVRLDNHESKTLPLTGISQMVPPRSFIDDLVWEGHLDGNLNLNRDEGDTDNLGFKLNTRIKHDRWRYILDVSQHYERENGVSTENNWETHYDQDYFFSDKWFARASYSELRDKFEYVDRQAGYAVGPGYRFWDNALGHFELIPQLVHLRLRSKDSEERLNAASLSWDYKRVLWGSRVEFYSSAATAAPIDADADYVFDGEAGLRYRLNDWASLSLLYELNQVSGVGNSAALQELSFGLGVGW